MKTFKEENGLRLVTGHKAFEMFAGRASTFFDEFFGHIWVDPQSGKLCVAVGFLRFVFVGLYRAQEIQ